MLMTSIDVEASKLCGNPKVAQRLQELRSFEAKDAIASVEERKERLTTFIREDIKSEKGMLLRQSNIQASAELSKMEGSHAQPPIGSVSVVFVIGKGYQLTEGEDDDKAGS